MVLFIESIIGIVLFTLIVVPMALKDPLSYQRKLHRDAHRPPGMRCGGAHRAAVCLSTYRDSEEAILFMEQKNRI